MNKYTVTMHHTVDESLLRQWQKLWDDSSESHFFNSPKWFLSCRDGLGIKKYTIVTIEANGQLEAVLTLVRCKKFGVTLWCSPGERFVDKSSLLLRKNEKSLLEALLAKLTSMGDFYLQELSSGLADALLVQNKALLKTESSTNYYLPLTSDPLKSMSNKNRNKILNKIKKYETNLQFKSFLGDPEGLKVAFALDKRSSKNKQGKSTFMRERERAFFLQLLKENGKNFSVDVLFYDNKPIIYGIGFTAKKTFYACITAYDDSYAFLSPGKMLHFYMFPRLQKEGRELFDFSRGVTVLKKDLTDLYTMQYDIFYTANPLIKLWWQSSHKLYYRILQSKTLYGLYLALKKFIYR